MKYWPKHFALSVADMDESIVWYEKILDFSLVSRMHLDACSSDVATLSNGTIEVELFKHDNTIAIPAERTNPDLDVQTQGMKHMAFGCDNLDEMMEHFKANGVEIVIGPVDLGTMRLCYIRDNTGNLLEFMQ